MAGSLTWKALRSMTSRAYYTYVVGCIQRPKRKEIGSTHRRFVVRASNVADAIDTVHKAHPTCRFNSFDCRRMKLEDVLEIT